MPARKCNRENNPLILQCSWFEGAPVALHPKNPRPPRFSFVVYRIRYERNPHLAQTHPSPLCQKRHKNGKEGIGQPKESRAAILRRTKSERAECSTLSWRTPTSPTDTPGTLPPSLESQTAPSSPSNSPAPPPPRHKHDDAAYKNLGQLTGVNVWTAGRGPRDKSLPIGKLHCTCDAKLFDLEEPQPSSPWSTTAKQKTSTVQGTHVFPPNKNVCWNSRA